MLKQKSSRELAIKIFVAGLVAVGLAACGDDSGDQAVVPTPAYQQTNPYGTTYDPSNPNSIYGAQPGMYPPGAYPPGAYSPGAYPPGAYPPGGFSQGYRPWAIPPNYGGGGGFFYFTVNSGPNAWCQYRANPSGYITVYNQSSGWMGGSTPYVRGGQVYVYGGGTVSF
jgi:hypothetical protein